MASVISHGPENSAHSTQNSPQTDPLSLPDAGNESPGSMSADDTPATGDDALLEETEPASALPAPIEEAGLGGSRPTASPTTIEPSSALAPVKAVKAVKKYKLVLKITGSETNGKKDPIFRFDAYVSKALLNF